MPDNLLQERTVDFFQKGQVFAFYLGHSGASGLWSNGVSFMNRSDWAKLNISHLQGVFFTCGCYACESKKSDKDDGYGLYAIRNSKGPVAVIGACGESYGAMGQLAFEGILKCFCIPKPPLRLADYWLAVQNGIASGEINPFIFYLYDQADGSQGKIPLDLQRLEHLEMWILLGDPATQLPLL